MSVITLLNQIKDNEIVLPAIQRDFVWPEESILRLLDSIMRGYPIGIALFWETYNDIQYRTFVADYKPDPVYAFHDNTARKKLKLVLDGQQRLQSLFIALYGSYLGQNLYLDVLSGLDSDDVAQEKYDFEFMTDKAFKQWQTQLEQIDAVPKPGESQVIFKYFVRVSELFGMGAAERNALKRRLTKNLSLSEKDEERLELNLGQFDYCLTKDPNILKVSVIDENLPEKSPNRKTEADVLEIFVRVNSEGTPLSRSDLIFSMLKLNWREAALDLPGFVRTINEGNTFELNTDFVIRCLFAVSDLGTKFDIDILRRKKNVDKLRSNFSQCCDAIQAVADFIQNECWCSNSEVLGGYNTFVPFVYYVFHLNKHEIPNSQIPNVRKALYLFGFARPFSRYADSRIGRFIRDELKPSPDGIVDEFPFDSAVSWMRYWEDIHTFGEKLLQANPIMTLYVVQNVTGAKIHYRRNVRELDHIFPRSVLREKGFDEAEINHFANFWILAKGKNQNKSARHPAKYFEDVDQSELDRALIERDLLDYRQFRKFLKYRSIAIQQKVRERLQLSNKDFHLPEAEISK
jgi:uncharacterized protein with ParB-like and HNH nuclease domain